MDFRNLANFLEKLEKTRSRIEITKILASLFKKAEKGETEKITNLLLGQLAPGYKGIVFNLAERMMLQVITQAYKKDLKEVKNLYKEEGDLGNVAGELAKGSSFKAKRKSIIEVYDFLLAIAQDEGEGSQERKIEKMARLLSTLDPLSVRYVARIPVGKLRLGFSDKTILDALSWLEKGDKSAKSDLEKAYNVLPDVGLLVRKVKEVGIRKVSIGIAPVIGVPVLPMLAQRLKSPIEMIEKMDKVAVEPKFDGLRIQLHYKSGKNGFIKAFTRNLNETSWMFPELESIGSQVKTKELILDSEAVGVDEKRKSLVNFQTTMTRRRKYEIEDIAKKVSIKFYVFDILHCDGKNLMNFSYLERRKILDKTLVSGKLLEVVDYKITKDSKVIEEMMRKELSEGLEGVIVKRANSRYVAGRTGWRWVKMKEEETSYAKLVDTLDCIVMGYSVGKGRRAQFGVGQFLVGVLGIEKIKSITKIGTGITDDKFRELKKRLTKLEVKEQPKEYEINKDLKPDYWVTPSLVVEIAADEITKSPKHTSGYALRFPRLVKFREDKSVDQATTVSEVERLFKFQKL
ncbi:hypothetical protein A2892_03725 [Candidatus Woesebacteria bacterium RIFCSPLOWO2_01_FULL_39_10b]|uniref:DNA ligase (ATP) n=1 Tax=Candidatus Woesebacteria bacterium RIFCSPLOWO2_01_FULL_39_10b TaxID=1802517 RepID=A0A1F8B7R4_9BACT|nr:MAG: hypothetical protein A2892_03725 [Candidatus Woesebacteria bacterium RIFCSPLOWO2_01_FULL_39_10b]